jgi:hypothetical protein
MIFSSRIRFLRTSGVLTFLFLASASLAGCVTDQSSAANAAPAPVGPGQAAITVTRTDGYQAALLSADLDANGSRIASLDRGATFTGGIKPGPVTLTVSTWSSPGQYTVHFNAEAGKRYAFEIAPRSEQLVVGIAAGMVGVVADAAINGENSGTFKIVAVPSAR